MLQPVNTLVRWIHVKFALNVVKAGSFVQIKLLSCKSRIVWGHFENSHLLFVCQYGYFKQRNSIEGKNVRKWVACIQKTDVTQFYEFFSRDWINRCRDIQSQRYFTTAESAFPSLFWSTLEHCDSARISPIHLIHLSFWVSFSSSFQLQDLF